MYNKRESNKRWRDNNPERVRAYRTKYNRGHQEEIKAYRIKYNRENKELRKEQQKNWREKNKRRRLEYGSRWEKKQRKESYKFRLDSNTSTAIRKALNNSKIGWKWEGLVRYTLEDLIKHLEVRYDENMTWDNYGSYWHIDHIIPRSWFIYKKPEDVGFKICWSLENLQPLEASKNIKKGNNIL